MEKSGHGVFQVKRAHEVCWDHGELLDLLDSLASQA